MGKDGIPGEAYKALGAILTKFIAEVMDNIAAGQPMPENWKIGGNNTYARKLNARMRKLPPHLRNANNL